MDYAKKNGYLHPQYFIDDGISGTTFDRPGFREMEDLIEAANGKPVLVMYAYQHDLTRIQQRFGKYSPDNPDGVRELKTSEDMED